VPETEGNPFGGRLVSEALGKAAVEGYGRYVQ